MTSSENGNGTNKVQIQINIISDTMCPWCWVGKRNMEAALQLAPYIDAKVEWWPFFLDKNLPEDGKPVRDYYRDNYGNPSVGENMMPGLIAAGRRVGLDFETTFSKLAIYRPTIKSHRLIEYAKRQGKQNEMVEALFRMYYVEGKHLNSVEHLVETAEVVGLSGVKDYLESNEDENSVYEHAAHVKGTANGVPTFLFTRSDQPNSRPISFSGGQPTEAFLEVFEHLSEVS